ncbi:MAG: universal stress protein [Aurantimonas endophytica]|uniref:Nucleotide-binding universal stress UspA family protein n=1 Tax=Aurantimonas endophytica TaxID=1522175 RepID=A0A7W6HBG4_9HYPH|nr:universal stress protein [Aurantimonas endophytica]MBB4002129.1 nucleotide-binding universal stress UspA family protein [Aurantimonas endophytica]MCO6402239.1 universal stress protein [Aurantimonas endophytica]
MRFRTMLCVIGSDSPDRDLEAALRLCEQNGSHLSVLLIGIEPSPPVAEYAAVAESWVLERQEAAKALAKGADAVRAVLAKSDISADLDCRLAEQAAVASEVGRHALYSDLVFVGPELAQSGERLKAATLKGALFEAQRPLLMAPQNGNATLQPRRVLVAWSSHPEAARAVREGIEILAAAEMVHVTMVDPRASEWGDGPEPGADIAAYLARHGAKVTVDRLPSGGNAVADVLRQHATDIDADMIMMGAYGHSRLREWIFGGVTRSVTESPPLSLFLGR